MWLDIENVTHSPSTGKDRVLPSISCYFPCYSRKLRRCDEIGKEVPLEIQRCKNDFDWIIYCVGYLFYNFFKMVLFGFVWFGFLLFGFILVGFVWFGFVLAGFVSFGFVSQTTVSQREPLNRCLIDTQVWHLMQDNFVIDGVKCLS